MKKSDIRINDKWYNIDYRSHRVTNVTDFAPRASTPGGSIVHSELNLYQPMLQTDWQHGFGFTWYTDDAGYMNTVGNLDTRHDGIVMMFTGQTASDTDDNKKYGFCIWNGNLYAWGDGGLRKFDGSGWSSVYNTAAVNYAYPGGTYLFFCPDGVRIKKMDTSNVISDAGNDADSTDYGWLTVHEGYMYAVKDDATYIHRDSTADLSDLEGTSGDLNVITAGFVNSYPIKRLQTYNSNLYAAKADGLWYVDTENLVAERTLDFANEASDNNFRSMTVHNGYLLFPIRDKIYQWNGESLSNVTPPRLTDTFPYTTYGQFDNFVSAGRFLLCTGQTNETNYNVDLLCFDGVGWHNLMTLTTSPNSITMMGYDPINDRLWYHLDTTADVTYYVQMQGNSDFPYANFPTTGTHEITTSKWDMGFRWVRKSSPSLVVETSNLSSSSYLTFYYSLDNGDWVEWDTIYESGTKTLTLPGGGRTLEFYYIKIKVRFTTTAAAQSPILEGLTLRFIMRPETLDVWSFNIPVGRNQMQNFGVDERSPAQMINDLKDARDSASPVEFEDIDGNVYYVYVTSLSRMAIVHDSAVGGDTPDIEYYASLNVVEVG